jgi:predicted transcriptional regulator
LQRRAQDVTSQEVQAALRDLVEDGFVRTSGQGMGMLITRN